MLDELFEQEPRFRSLECSLSEWSMAYRPQSLQALQLKDLVHRNRIPGCVPRGWSCRRRTASLYNQPSYAAVGAKIRA